MIGLYCLVFLSELYIMQGVSFEQEQTIMHRNNKAILEILGQYQFCLKSELCEIFAQ